MAMLRSALGRVSRRLLGPSEIIRTPPLHPAETLMSHPEPAPQLMRTFMSPAATGATKGIHRVPSFQGWQHFPVISKGAEGMKCSQQKRFFSVESKESSRVMAWLDRHFGPRRQLMVVMIGGVSSFVATTIAYRRIDKAPTAVEKRG